MAEEVVGLVVLLVTLVFLPGVCIFVTRQAAEGLVGRNASAGIRTRHTQASDGAWISGHRAALPVLKTLWPVAAAGILVATGTQILAGGATGIVVALVALIAETGILLRSAAAANRAARAVRDD